MKILRTWNVLDGDDDKYLIFDNTYTSEQFYNNSFEQHILKINWMVTQIGTNVILYILIDSPWAYSNDPKDY